MCRGNSVGWPSACGLAVVLSLWAAHGASTADAALLAYDPFVVGGDPGAGEYTAGNIESGFGLLAGQNPTTSPDPTFYAGGWIQGGGDASVVRNNPSLTYPGVPNGGIGLVRLNNRFDCCTFERNGRPFGNVFDPAQPGLFAGRDPRELWGSFLIDWGSIGTNADNGNQGKHGFEMWSDSPADNPDSKLVLDLFFNYYSGTDELTLRWGPDGSSVQQVVAGSFTRDELTAINNGSHLVIMKLEFGNAAGEDHVKMWLDPVLPFNWGAPPSASLALPAGTVNIWGHSAFSAFQFDGGGSRPGAIDEFRWGTDVGSVVTIIPEPSALMMLIVGVVGLAMRSPRR